MSDHETVLVVGDVVGHGITAVVDPYGRVVKQAGMFEPLGLTADVRLLDSRTIYTRTGDLMAWLCAALTACVAVVLRRRA